VTAYDLDSPARHKDVSVLELTDRILGKGVVLHGEITLSVADVDLVHVGLRLLLASTDTVERLRSTALGGSP
jgi:gas vesicle structural protein